MHGEHRGGGGGGGGGVFTYAPSTVAGMRPIKEPRAKTLREMEVRGAQRLMNQLGKRGEMRMQVK
jgi:hypothetical protein